MLYCAIWWSITSAGQFCLFNWFALYLPCALCHYLFFSTMSSFVDLYSLYVHMFKLYLSVFVRLLSVFNVNCMHQGSESNAISILCMCCTVGRIDNKADFDVYFKCQLQKKYCTIVCMYFMYVPNVMLTLWLCSDSCHTCADSKQLLINLSCYIINKYWI